ncbi:Serine/threonine-protein kinase pim-1 [Lonchura striata]|uniref:non-specific serine/threonine protein kinase n=1 Tax=Lonchura striata TaxID=40157 RepID=A0A218UIG8_9PASE|nr:Serine/threonine-protein kinase pim-1 [Lonchura striata domestica]
MVLEHPKQSQDLTSGFFSNSSLYTSPRCWQEYSSHPMCHWGNSCTSRDAGARLWEQQHPPDELHLYSIETRSYSHPEWTHFGWYYGKPATIWSLGILLHQMVCGEHPFRRGQNIRWDHQLSLPQWLSQECQDLIRQCLSMLYLDRPSLEELFCDPWVQNIHLP